MISLDQVILLEKKVESAVAKIQQLKAENDALRSKCSELTNALSAKSEQLSSFVNDQSQIENGIRKALDRLNAIENSVLKSDASINSNATKNQNINQKATFQDLKPVQQNPKASAQIKSVQQAPVKPAVSMSQKDFTAEAKSSVSESVNPLNANNGSASNIPSMYMEMEDESENQAENETVENEVYDDFSSEGDSFFDQNAADMNLSEETANEIERNQDNFDLYQQNPVIENATEDFDENSSDISDEQTDLGFDIF